MSPDPLPEIAATTEAVAAQAQSRDQSGGRSKRGIDPECAGLGVQYLLGAGLRRVSVAPYRRASTDPLYRPLRIFSIDPSTHRLDGAIATVNVPYEPLEPGPIGYLYEVENRNGCAGESYRRADLNDMKVLMEDGYVPSLSDPRFHQQMVYAVCSNVYAAFRLALGRNLSWGFGNETRAEKLTLRPYCEEERNAYYWTDGRRGELRFGYYKADYTANDGTLPGGYVFTCLSHDIVAHEISHALLDGLRSNFCVPSGPDVLAFHEAFADIVAIFQRFSYREVLLTAIRRSKGSLMQAELLTQLASQFGHTTGKNKALRQSLDECAEKPAAYSENQESHQLGSILVNAIFEAFIRVFERKTEQYLRLATAGTGILPAGELSYDLQCVLADKASKLAGQFLSICIRAIDYCPPVGITLGDYLRALITADHELVPDDPWDYRGALIDAFRRRNIYPRTVPGLSPDALVWRSPRKHLPPVPGLDFATLRFRGDPSQFADLGEQQRQACALGRYVVAPDRLAEFGLVANGDSRLDGDTVSLPCIESIRTARRAGPDRQIVFDLVAEVTQMRYVRASARGPAFTYHGGSTVILGPEGDVRYIVLKSVAGEGRIERRRQYLESMQGRKFWKLSGDRLEPAQDLFRLAHQEEAHGEG